MPLTPSLLVPLLLASLGAARAPVRGSARVGDLTAKTRAALPDDEFAIPSDRSFPIHDRLHAKRALAYVSAPSNRKKRYRVLFAVLSRYPGLRSIWERGKGGRAAPLDGEALQDALSYYRRKILSVPSVERKWLRSEILAIEGLIEMS